MRRLLATQALHEHHEQRKLEPITQSTECPLQCVVFTMMMRWRCQGVWRGQFCHRRPGLARLGPPPACIPMSQDLKQPRPRFLMRPKVAHVPPRFVEGLLHQIFRDLRRAAQPVGEAVEFRGVLAHPLLIQRQWLGVELVGLAGFAGHSGVQPPISVVPQSAAGIPSIAEKRGSQQRLRWRSGRPRMAPSLANRLVRAGSGKMCESLPIKRFSRCDEGKHAPCDPRNRQRLTPVYRCPTSSTPSSRCR